MQLDIMTFAKRFSQYAYETVACGKLHHMGPDQLQGWTHIRGCHENIDPKYIEGRVEEEFHKYNSFPKNSPHNPEAAISKKWSDAKEILRVGVARSRVVFHDQYTLTGALEYIERHFIDP